MLPLRTSETEIEEITKMLKRRVIEPLNSPWSSPVVLVTKKDGRFCVDFKAVNIVIIHDALPLPKISDCLESQNDSKWNSWLNPNQRFL